MSEPERRTIYSIRSTMRTGRIEEFTGAFEPAPHMEEGTLQLWMGDGHTYFKAGSWFNSRAEAFVAGQNAIRRQYESLSRSYKALNKAQETLIDEMFKA